MSYALFKGGDTTALASGSIANGGSSGLIVVDNISVVPGDMLYLQIGNDTMNHWYDQTEFTFRVVVPEPSTTVLLACGLFGLLCYAWRKRK